MTTRVSLPIEDGDCPECNLPIPWHQPEAVARCASGFWRDMDVTEDEE